MKLTIKLNPVQSEIIEHRLSAETLGQVAADTFAEEAADDVRERIAAAADLAAACILRFLGEKTVYITSTMEAWCLADCVEGSTWADSQDTPADRRRAARQEQSLRRILNRDCGFTHLLGRQVADVAEVVSESAEVKAAFAAAAMKPETDNIDDPDQTIMFA